MRLYPRSEIIDIPMYVHRDTVILINLIDHFFQNESCKILLVTIENSAKSKSIYFANIYTVYFSFPHLFTSKFTSKP